MASLDSYFSVLALFILFRETIEASIICGVLLQFLNRSKPGLKRAVWYGIASGVGVSIVFGVIFIAVYYTASNNLFRGKNRDWFKGVISWVAAVLITILGFAMLRFLGWEEKWQRRLTAAIKQKMEEAGSQPTQQTTDTVGAPAPPAAKAFPAPADENSSDSGTDSAAAIAAASATSSDGAEGVKKPPPPAAVAPVEAAATTTPRANKDARGADLELALQRANTNTSTDMTPGTKAEKANLDLEAAQAAALEDVCDLSPPTRKESMKIWVLVFTTVVREGIESVVFLGGLGGVKFSAIPLPAFVGIFAGCLVGVFLYYSGKQVKDIKWLIISMAIVIFFIAAGQVNLGTDALMRAGLFGYCSPWYDERHWIMVPIYNWSQCCNDIDPNGSEPRKEQNARRFFALARAIFGYQDKGTPLEIILYCCYWALMFIIAGYKYRQGTLFDADFKHKREQRRKEKEARRAAEAEAAMVAEANAVVAAEAEAVERGGLIESAAEEVRLEEKQMKK